MSAVRTQIYLTQEHRDRIDDVVRAEGVTLAEVIRRALDQYFEQHSPDPRKALVSTFGADPDISIPSRDEWDRG